jgi:hypothetical protein
MIKCFIDPVSASKIMLLSEVDCRECILEIMGDAEKIPVEYGGRLKMLTKNTNSSLIQLVANI